MSSKTLVCLGDSIVEGEGDELNLGGWVGRVAKRLPGSSGEATPSWRVFNLGIGGNTIRDVKYRLGEVVLRHPDVVILGCGGNDVRYVTQETWDGTPEHNISRELTVEAWESTLKTLKAICPNVAVIGRYPMKNTSVTEADCIKHNSFIAEQCAKFDVEYIEPPKFLADSANISHGSHPNAVGYELYGEYMFAKLKQLTWI